MKFLNQTQGERERESEVKRNMFYSHCFLSRKGPLGTIWVAAHCLKRVKKHQVAQINISSSVGHLLLGVVRIYSKKVEYLFHDCRKVLVKVNDFVGSKITNILEDGSGVNERPDEDIMLADARQNDGAGHDSFDKVFLEASPLSPNVHIPLESLLGTLSQLIQSIHNPLHFASKSALKIAVDLAISSNDAPRLTNMAGRAIRQLLRGRLQSQSSCKKTTALEPLKSRMRDQLGTPWAPPVLSSLVSKKDQEGAGSAGMNSLRAFALLGAGVSGLLSFTMIAAADEAGHGLPCPNYPWIRRGHQVYQQVCASCHSMSLISYRDLVGVAHTEEETKAMAAEIEVVDGPNDEGEMFTRPGKLSDRFPQPYPNEQAARFANGGAYPPDLSLITKARHNGQNYVFALLTGYHDPPAGVSIREGLHYNPYFPGGAIAMPKMLIDGAVEYEDGTPATESQMGKDVVTFLSWAAEPEMEERKLMGFKWIFVLSLALLQAAYYRRMRWSVLKSRKLIIVVVGGGENKSGALNNVHELSCCVCASEVLLALFETVPHSLSWGQYGVIL
ncbi:unnamed protein product [Camellia sinensis]